MWLFTLWALTATLHAEDYLYSTSNGEITINSYTGAGGAVTIPGTINGLPVVSIGRYAFYAQTHLTSVTIPASVTSIGEGTFEGCDGLTSASIPGSVTHIEDSTFSGCTGLISVNIPGGVTHIGDTAFFDCTGLTSVDIPNSVTSIGSGAFGDCSGLTSVSIPSGVTSIGSSAFYNCIGLTDVSISGSVTSIGNYAFFNCAGLSTITVDPGNTTYSSLDGVLFDQAKTTLMFCPMQKAGDYSIPASVTSIGESAFFGCAGLTSVSIPAEVTSVGSEAFSGCTGLTSVSLPDSMTDIGSSAFSVCAGLTSVAIPGGVTSIGDSAFNRCSGLTLVDIPGSVIHIGSYAFDSCPLLTAITVDPANPAYSSEEGVLFNLAKTTLMQFPGGKAGSYTIPASVTSLAGSGFYGSQELMTIWVAPGNTTYSSVDGVLFNQDHSQLIQCPRGRTGSYTIPASVTRLDYHPLRRNGLTNIDVDEGNPNYSSLDGVLFDKLQATLIQYPGGKTGAYTVPGSVTMISPFAFYYCTGLTSVIIPTSVTTIGIYAFSECAGLTSVTIPASVTDIASLAFYGCASLASANFAGNAPYVEWLAFGATAVGFTVYYFDDRTGFSSPTWAGYPAVNMGNSSPAVVWLLANGMPHDTDLQADPDGDGVTLLMAYGLNLDPKQNLSGSMPRPLVSGNQLSIRFYAGGEGVSYTVESSRDLHFWNATDVTLSALDANKFRVATVPTTAPRRFLRLALAITP